MDLRIEFRFPQQTEKLLRYSWLGLISLVVVSLAVYQEYLLSVLSALLLSLAYFWQRQQFKSLYRNAQGIIFHQENWFILRKNAKLPIEVLASSRLLGAWISLDYRLEGRRHNQIIFKDAVSDEDFRALSRNLKFHLCN